MKKLIFTIACLSLFSVMTNAQTTEPAAKKQKPAHTEELKKEEGKKDHHATDKSKPAATIKETKEHKTEEKKMVSPTDKR